MYSQELKRHLQKCTFVLVERSMQDALLRFQSEISALNAKHQQHVEMLKNNLTFAHQQQLTDLCIHHDRDKSEMRTEIAKLQTENQLLRHELTEAQLTSRKLAEQAINRPTTIANNTTNQQHNEIGSISNVKVTTYLSDFDTYQRQTDPQRVRQLLDQHLEQYFFDGQPGLARFMVDHVIRSQDGKMIMVCTDTSRKRFRFVNADAKLEEDLRAKMLAKKLSIPVKEVCATVFDRIINRLSEEKTNKKSAGAGAFEIDFLDKKIDFASLKFLNIREFDTDVGNEFLTELSSLLRGPQIDQEDD